MPVFIRWLLALGPANPIAVRLIQNGSRRSRHMYIRSAYLALLVLVMLWALLVKTSGSGGATSFRDLSEAGASTFTAVAYLQIFLICVLSPVFMAGAIAQEASPRTWEVLLTTPLGRLQIVLGNLLGRLFFVLALLFASLPLFALTQYFGGVPGSSIFASYLVAAAAALLVGAIAIALAVSRIAGRRAVFTFYVAVVTYLGITYGIDQWLQSRSLGAGGGGGVTWLTGLNPFLALNALLNPTTYPSADRGTLAGLSAFMLETPVRAWILIATGLSLALVAASTLTVRTGGFARRQVERRKLPWYRRMLGLSAGASSEDGQAYRPPRSVWHNPIAWREAAARNATLGRILARWSFIVFGILLAIALIFAYDTSAITAADYRLAILVIVLVELAVTTLVSINMSATAISREREDGTLDLLLTTPVTPAEYLGGKLRGLVAYLLPMIAVPVVTMLLAGVHALIGGFGQPDNAMVPAGPAVPGNVMIPVVLPEAGIIMALSAAPFMALCVMIGLHWSLKSKGAIASVVGAVIVAAITAAVVGGCGFNAGRSIPAVGPALLGLSPFASGLAMVEPVKAMYETVTQGGANQLATARFALLVGAAISAGLHLAAVWALHSQMVRRFDMTVRKLAGTS